MEKIYVITWYESETDELNQELVLTKDYAIREYHNKRGYERERNIYGLQLFEATDITDEI